MSNDLSGTQGSSQIFPTGTDSTLTTPTSATNPLSKGTSISGVYDGTDILTDMAVNFTPQVLPTPQKSFTDTSADQPIPPAPDSEGEIGPQPIGAKEQKLVMRFFYKRISELASKTGLSADEMKSFYSAIASGAPLTDTRFQSIFNQAKKDTQEQTPLPQSWTPTSTNQKDWIKQPMQPYSDAKKIEINDHYDQALKNIFKQYVAEADPPLTKTEEEQLRQAISEGKVSPDIFEDFQAITKAARKETQKTYGLSESWYKDTPNTDDWKPINLSPLAPAAVNQTQAEQLLSNINDYALTLDQVAERLSKDLGPEQQVSMDEFRSAISKAIQYLKSVLRDIQLKDNEVSADVIKNKLEEADARFKELQKSIDEKREAERKQEKAKKTSFILKIVGPIVAALSTIVGAALAIFTFGASTALIVAGIAVGIALTTYSIVDSATGCTSKLMEVINDSLKEAFPNDPVMQKVIKFTAMVAIVLVLIFIIVITAGGGAASIGSSVAAQIAKETVKQLMIQLIIMTIMTSNAIPELLGEILKAKGIDEKSSKIAEIVMMAITMLVIIASVIVGGKGVSATAKGISEGFMSGVRSVKEFMTRVSQMIKTAIDEIRQGVIETLKATLKLLQKLLENLSRGVTSMVEAAKNLPNTIFAALKNAAQTVKDAIKAINEQIQNLYKVKELTPQLRTSISASFAAAAENLEAAFKALRDAMERAFRAAQEAATTAKDAAISSAKVTIEEVKASMQRVSEMTMQQLAKLKDVPGAIGEEAKNVALGFKTIGRGIKNIPKVMQEAQQLRRGAEAGIPQAQLEQIASSQLKHAQEGLAATQKVLRMTEHSLNFSNGVIQGVVGMQVARLTESAGDHMEAAAMIQAIIDLFEKLLQNIQTGTSARADFIVSLQEFYSKFFKDLGRSTSKIFNFQG